MHKQIDFEIDFDGREHGINPNFKRACFELEIGYSEHDASFSHHYGVQTATINVADEITGEVFLLNENGDTMKQLRFELLSTNPFLWAQRLTQIGVERAHQSINE